MKIPKITGPLQAQRSAQARSKDSQSSFSQMLEKARGTVGTTTVATMESQGVDPLVGVGNLPLPMGPQEVLERAERLLNLMDDFAQALGDSRRNLRSIEPIVRRMEKGVQDLEASSQDQSEDLVKLTEKIAMTAQIETMKFDRGDYM